jgi:hypothetical protein
MHTPPYLIFFLDGVLMWCRRAALGGVKIGIVVLLLAARGLELVTGRGSEESLSGIICCWGITDDVDSVSIATDAAVSPVDDFGSVPAVIPNTDLLGRTSPCSPHRWSSVSGVTGRIRTDVEELFADDGRHLFDIPFDIDSLTSITSWATDSRDVAEYDFVEQSKDFPESVADKHRLFVTISYDDDSLASAITLSPWSECRGVEMAIGINMDVPGSSVDDLRLLFVFSSGVGSLAGVKAKSGCRLGVEMIDDIDLKLDLLTVSSLEPWAISLEVVSNITRALLVR